MTKTQSLVQNIGLSNLITIGVLIVGLSSTFIGLSAKVDGIARRLEDEVVQRQVEDERLRMEIDQNWKSNAEEHLALRTELNIGFTRIEATLSSLDKTMNYHIGYHSGKGQ